MLPGNEVVDSQKLKLPLAPLPAKTQITVWPHLREGQKHVSRGGKTKTTTWAKMIAWFEAEHGPNGPIKAKGTGRQWAFGSNEDGHRVIMSMHAMHGLVLDCDGSGEWDTLCTALEERGLSYVAHESPSHRAGVPKWRIAIPFAVPFVLGSDKRAANEAWKRFYVFAAGVFGELAGGDETFFDLATKVVSNIFYLGYRQTEEWPLRRVRHYTGQAIDAAALWAQVPPEPEPEQVVGSNDGYKRAAKDGGGATLPPDTLITLPGGGGTLADIASGARGRWISCYCPLHDYDEGKPNASIGMTAGGCPYLTCFGDCGHVTYYALRDTLTETEKAEQRIARQVEQAAAETALDHVETEEEKAYYAPFRARVAERHAKAALVDRELVDRAVKVKDRAFTLANTIRNQWRKDAKRLAKEAEAEVAKRANGNRSDENFAAILTAQNASRAAHTWLAAWDRPCGWSQALVNVKTGQQRGVDRVCSNLSCRRCGPTAVARKAEMLALTFAEHETVYRFVLTTAGFKGWRGRYKRCDPVASITSKKAIDATGSQAQESLRALDPTAITLSSRLAIAEYAHDHFPKPLPSKFASITLDQSRVVVYSSVDCSRQRGQRESVSEITGTDAAARIREEVPQAYRVTTSPDPRGGAQVRVVGYAASTRTAITTSQTISLDPDKIARMAERSWYAEEGRTKSTTAHMQACDEVDVSYTCRDTDPGPPGLTDPEAKADATAKHKTITTTSRVTIANRKKILEVCGRAPRVRGKVKEGVFGFDSKPDSWSVAKAEPMKTESALAPVDGETIARLQAELKKVQGAYQHVLANPNEVPEIAEGPEAETGFISREVEQLREEVRGMKGLLTRYAKKLGHSLTAEEPPPQPLPEEPAETQEIAVVQAPDPGMLDSFIASAEARDDWFWNRKSTG